MSAVFDHGPDPQVRVVLRPLASPFALGFLALAAAALLAAGLDLGWIPQAERLQVGLLILVVVPAPLLLASVFGFLARDPVAATGLAITGVMWAAHGLSFATTPPSSTSDALGTLLLVGTVALGLSAVEAGTGKLVPAAVMGATALHFLASALHQLSGNGGWKVVAGITGLVVCVLAVHGAAALALEDLRRRTVLPTGRHGEGLLAMDQDLRGQVSDVATEAGVRRQL